MKVFRIFGEVTDTTFYDFNNFLSEIGEEKEISIEIFSQGGYVDAGLAICNKIAELKSKGVIVSTISLGRVASISETIFICGSIRIVHSSDQFLIHPPHIPYAEGLTVDTMTKDINSLKDSENILFSMHRSVSSILTDDEIWAQIKNETWINAQDYLNMGYATELIEFKAVAKFNQSNNNQSNNMDEKTTGILNGIATGINSIMAKLSNSPKAILLQSVTGEELEFPEIKDGSMPTVGAKVLLASVQANGSFVMPTGETYVCNNGVLNEIVSAGYSEKELTEAKSTIETLTAENSELKSKLDSAIASIKAINSQVDMLKAEMSGHTKLKTEISQNKKTYKSLLNLKIS